MVFSHSLLEKGSSPRPSKILTHEEQAQDAGPQDALPIQIFNFLFFYMVKLSKAVLKVKCFFHSAPTP